MLQRALENLASIQSLRVNFVVAGEARDTKFRFTGIFTFGKPDHWRIDLIGGFMTPQLTIIQNQVLSVYPASLESSFTPESLRFLARTGAYLTGDILADFAVPEAVVRKQGGTYTYTAAGATVVIDALSGVINEYRNDTGLLLRFRHSAGRDGVDFPAEIAVAAAKDGITGTVTLQNLQMNRPLDPAAFIYHEAGTAP
jgi:hypothetical protein